MRDRLLPALLLAAIALPEAAFAEARVRTPGTAAMGDIVLGPVTIDELHFARQVQPPGGGGGDVSPTGLALSKTIYLNRNGANLQPGNNDSRTNRSSIVENAVSIPAWNVNATTWAAVRTCMQDMFAAYDVVVTDVDPGATPHVEALFGGSPGQLGLPNNVAGVSPFTTDCSIIENAIVYTFTNVLPQNDPRLICEVMAQEVAHAYGLDHELLASDPMTYLPYDGNRSFQNVAAQCGEDETRPCGINGSVCRSNQNSVQLLTERLGAKPGVTPPPPGGTADPQDDDDDDVPGSGSGGGGGGTGDPAGADDFSQPIVGGCSTSGGGAGLGLMFVLVGLTVRRRAHA